MACYGYSNTTVYDIRTHTYAHMHINYGTILSLIFKEIFKNSGYYVIISRIKVLKFQPGFILCHSIQSMHYLTHHVSGV